ncbi:hypothetical protein [Halalkalicoccus salilacus]|uniref:hypothetical protein n=1 Tax=Halalkalicoccus sp. GCM10025704 TaxID=3252662 RepID=UPI003605FE5B
MAALISPPNAGMERESAAYSSNSPIASGGSSSASVACSVRSVVDRTRATLAGWSWTTPTSVRSGSERTYSGFGGSVQVAVEVGVGVADTGSRRR